MKLRHLPHQVFLSLIKGNKNEKQLKGILKMPGEIVRTSTSAPRQV